MVAIVPLARIDPGPLDELLDAAFGSDRRSRTAYRLREGTPWLRDLSFGATDRGVLVGSIQAWPIALVNGDARTPLTLVGPVAVSPLFQRNGIGRQLMEQCLVAATAHSHDALVLIGDAEYYGCFFGFSAETTARWQLAGPVDRHRLLARYERGAIAPAEGRLGPDPAFASAAATA